MEPFRYHVYACQQEKPGNLPCCAARGSAQVLEALRKEIAAQGLTGDVQVTTCGSIGLCERGPNMIVYPEGVWYSNVQVADVPELVREHFEHGRPVERLLGGKDPAALKKEIEENRAKAMAAMAAMAAAQGKPPGAR